MATLRQNASGVKYMDMWGQKRNISINNTQNQGPGPLGLKERTDKHNNREHRKIYMELCYRVGGGGGGVG